MDIDDILASVEAGGGGGGTGPAGQGGQAARDLRELTRSWVNERGAPEVLPWPEALVERVLERVRKQIEVVEDQSAEADPATSFRLIVVQTELERFKFLVRSLLRARIAKIDRNALHYVSNEGARAALSASEREYAAAHQALLAEHYRAAFLSQFPPGLQRLDDTAGGIAMVDAPDADRAVFVRARAAGDGAPVRVDGTDIDFEMSAGSVYVVRWSAVRDRVLGGEAELL